MKLRPLVLCASIALFAAAAAGALDYSLGLRGGASGSFLSGAYATALDTSLAERGSLTRTPQPLLSYRADAFFRVGITGWFAVQAEAGFGPIGGGVLASNGLNLLVGVSGNEIRLPVMAVFSLTAPFGTFSLMAGPFAGYSIVPQLIENNGLVYTTSPLQPMFYAGLAGGLEYRLPLGPGSLVVDARYTHRILPTIMDTNALTPLAIELTAGYMITIKK